MLSGVMEHFGFSTSLHPVVYYDSEYHQQVFKDLKAAICCGRHRGVHRHGRQWQDRVARADATPSARGRPD